MQPKLVSLCPRSDAVPASRPAARSAALPALLALLAGCAGAPSPMTDRFFFTHTEPERLACLLVPPLENASTVRRLGPLAAEVFAKILNDSGRFRAISPGMLTAMLEPFGVTELPLENVDVARLLAGIIGADSYVHGAVSGAVGVDPPQPSVLVLDARVISAKHRHRVLWGGTILLEAAGDATADLPLEAALSERIAVLVQSLQRDVRPRRMVAPEACFHAIMAASERLKKGKESPDTHALEASLMELALVAIPGGADAEESVPEPTPAPVQLSAQAEELVHLLEDGAAMELPGVRFVRRRSLRVRMAGVRIALLGEILRAKPDWDLDVRVHTNATRSPQADRRITQAQARVLARKLRQLWGLSESRVKAVGMGAQNPKKDDASAPANRRVEVARRVAQ